MALKGREPPFEPGTKRKIFNHPIGGGFFSGPAIYICRVSKDRSHNALVVGENPLGITTAEEPSRQGDGRRSSRKG